MGPLERVTKAKVIAVCCVGVINGNVCSTGFIELHLLFTQNPQGLRLAGFVLLRECQSQAVAVLCLDLLDNGCQTLLKMESTKNRAHGANAIVDAGGGGRV